MPLEIETYARLRSGAPREYSGSGKRSPEGSGIGFVGSSRLVPKPANPFFSWRFFQMKSALETPKEAAGLTDIAAHALRMRQHAQPVLHLPRLDLLVSWTVLSGGKG